MIKAILAIFVAALPLASFAQNSAQKPGEQGEAAEKARRVPEVSVVEAIKLRTAITAAIAKLELAAQAFRNTITAGLDKDTSTLPANAGQIAAAEAKLEVAGVKLESFFDKAARLRVRTVTELGTSEGVRFDDAARTINIPDSVRAHAATAGARLQLANARMEGGAAAQNIVGHKILLARQGKDSTVPAIAVERMRAAIIEISGAKAALNGGKARQKKD